jgi:hypothetical protein
MPAASAAVELAPVDDHLHVVLARVVLDELRIELIGQRPGDNAVDHRQPILLRTRE